MRTSFPVRSLRRASLVVVMTATVGAMAPIVAAQTSSPLVGRPSFQTSAANVDSAATPPAPPGGALVIGEATRAAMAAAASGAAPRVASGRSARNLPRGATVGDDVLLGVAGVVGGFFGGGYVGYGLDRGVFGDHGGDDPGLKGFLWGGFIGAIALPIALIHWLG